MPYALDARVDEEGHRVPIAGPANAALNKLLAAAHEELLATKADPRLGPLTVAPDATSGRLLLSRPRDNLEMMQEVLFASDPAFGGGPPRWIVRRDDRGYARITGGAVPAPFLDAETADFYLPDVKHIGGIGELLALARLSASRGVQITPHNPSGPISTLASASALASVPHAAPLEFAWGEVAWRGHHTDGSAFAVRGVIIATIRDDKIAAARLYVEPVESSGEDIDAAVERLSRSPHEDT